MICVEGGGFWSFDLVDSVGVVVAVVGLCFVWSQLRQVKRQLALQNYSEYTKRYSDIALRLPESINFDPFDFEEWRNSDGFMRNMRAFFDLCFEEWDLNNRRLIAQDSWSVWKGGIQTAMKRDAFRQAWEIIRDTSDFGTEFNKWMNSVSDDSPRKT